VDEATESTPGKTQLTDRGRECKKNLGRTLKGYRKGKRECRRKRVWKGRINGSEKVTYSKVRRHTQGSVDREKRRGVRRTPHAWAIVLFGKGDKGRSRDSKRIHRWSHMETKEEVKGDKLYQ